MMDRFGIAMGVDERNDEAAAALAMQDYEALLAAREAQCEKDMADARAEDMAEGRHEYYDPEAEIVAAHAHLSTR